MDESPSFFEPVERRSKALLKDTIIRSSVVGAVSARLVLEKTRLLSVRLSCVLTISTIMSMKKERKWKMSYTSLGPEAKSTRELCIRVAAIVITITLGNSNN